MMAICEFLHCSYSELEERCPSLADRILILEYIKVKNEKEEYAMREAQARGE
jgi:hypothetical protein